MPVNSINAKDSGAYVLMDAESGRLLYGSNSQSQALTASICKIMTAIVAIENGELFKSVKVTREASLCNGSSLYLKENDEIILVDLIYGLMLRSGNDAALLISQNVFNTSAAFIKEMNNYAKKIGMKNSTFENPSGLDDDSFNYSTPYDMALLMRYALQNELFCKINSTRAYRATSKDNSYYWVNKHKLIANYSYVKGGKTGYTKKALRTLVSYAEIDGKRLIAVSFKYSDDYNLHLSLFKKANDEFVYQKIIDAGVYKANLEGLNYYPKIERSVGLLVKKHAKIAVIFYLKKDPDDTCGYMSIYENSNEIMRQELYPYWPLK